MIAWFRSGQRCGKGQVAELKERLRKAYLRYRDLDDSVPDTCGRKIAEHIRPELATARAKVNEILAELRKVDPLAPKEDV